MKKAWAALKDWLKRQPRHTLIFLGVAGVFLLWFLYVPPLLAIRGSTAHWRKLGAELEEARQAIGQVRSGGVRQLPSTEAVSEILEELHVQGRDYHVEILGVSPGSHRAGEAGMVILPVELQLEGEYRALGEFLGALSKTPSLGVVSVKHLQISRQENLLPQLRAQVSVEFCLREGTGGGS